MLQSDYGAFDGLRERWIDLSLATIHGHGHVVAALRQRVLTRRHDTGIILHGLPGVGKRTLARLYARALLCETPTETGEACGACNECRSFVASRPLGYYEIDATRKGDEKTARKLVKDLKEDALTQRRVVIIGNADRCEDSVFDSLLKTLEEPKTPATFILLASALAEVRLAGQSRCEPYRLRSLTADEARPTLKAMLAAAGAEVDERVIDVLVGQTGGYVGRMHSIVMKVAALHLPTLEFVRAALGHDWVEGVASYWRAVLAENEPDPEALVPPATGQALKCLDRMRMLLLALRPQTSTAAQTAPPADPAFLHREDMFTKLSGLLMDRASSLGVSTEALWGGLAQYWLLTDHGSLEGLREAGQWTRSIVTGRAGRAAAGCGVGP